MTEIFTRLQQAEAELELASSRFREASFGIKAATTALQQAQREHSAALKESQTPAEPEEITSYVHNWSEHKRTNVR
jgi:exonuclease VII small subunit